MNCCKSRTASTSKVIQSYVGKQKRGRRLRMLLIYSEFSWIHNPLWLPRRFFPSFKNYKPGMQTFIRWKVSLKHRCNFRAASLVALFFIIKRWNSPKIKCAKHGDKLLISKGKRWDSTGKRTHCTQQIPGSVSGHLQVGLRKIPIWNWSDAGNQWVDLT